MECPTKAGQTTSVSKSLKAEELAQCLIQALAVEYAIQPGALLAAMKDGASVNQAAMQQVRFFFPQLLDVTYFSHTIDNVGKHFEFRVLDTFAQYWVSLFSHSAAARLAWKARTGTAMRTYSPTRWWSKWKVMNLVLEYFVDVEPFVRENDHLAPATRAHLMEIFNSPADSKDLELELATFVDGGNHFVSATYYLEGDGPLVFSCYERYSIQCYSRSRLPQCGRSSSPPSRRKLACLQSAGGQSQSMYQSGVAVFSEKV